MQQEGGREGGGEGTGEPSETKDMDNVEEEGKKGGGEIAEGRGENKWRLLCDLFSFKFWLFSFAF